MVRQPEQPCVLSVVMQGGVTGAARQSGESGVAGQCLCSFFWCESFE